VWRWPGWENYRPTGRAGGRPRLGGTPVVDEPVAAGYLRDWLWSRCACEGDHEEMQFESYLSARIVTCACKYVAQVTTR
jgi:hypothetical protein